MECLGVKALKNPRSVSQSSAAQYSLDVSPTQN